MSNLGDCIGTYEIDLSYVDVMKGRGSVPLTIERNESHM